MIQRTPGRRGRSSSRSCQRALHEAMPSLPRKARHAHSHACRSTLLLQQRHSQVGALDSGIAPRVPRWMLVSTNGHQIANPALISLRSERVQPPRLHNTSQPGRPTKAEIGMMSNLGMLQNRLLCVSIAGFKKRWQPTALTSALYHFRVYSDHPGRSVQLEYRKEDSPPQDFDELPKHASRSGDACTCTENYGHALASTQQIQCQQQPRGGLGRTQTDYSISKSDHADEGASQGIIANENCTVAFNEHGPTVSAYAGT